MALLLHMTNVQFVQTNVAQSAASGLDKGDWGINWGPGESGFQVTKHQTSKPNTKSAIPNSNSRSFVANLLVTFPRLEMYGRYQCGSRLLSDASKQEELPNQLRAMLSLLRDEESGICR